MPDINSSDPDFEDLEPDGVCPKCGGPMFEMAVGLKCIDGRCNKLLFSKDENRNILDDNI